MLAEDLQLLPCMFKHLTRAIGRSPALDMEPYLANSYFRRFQVMTRELTRMG